jgi:nitrogen fixation NifU-like protein
VLTQTSAPDEDLMSLYQEIILDHGKNPRNRGIVEDYTCISEGRNPLCGDRVTVTASVDGSNIRDVRFDGKGCAISIASASMMTESLVGLNRDQATQIFESVKSICTEDTANSQRGSQISEELSQRLEKLMALSGVRNFPVRVKCATLPWYAFMSCLEGKSTATTEIASWPRP